MRARTITHVSCYAAPCKTVCVKILSETSGLTLSLYCVNIYVIDVDFPLAMQGACYRYL